MFLPPATSAQGRPERRPPKQPQVSDRAGLLPPWDRYQACAPGSRWFAASPGTGSENRLAGPRRWAVLCLASGSSTPRGGALDVDPLRPSGDSQATQAAKVVPDDPLSTLLVQRRRRPWSQRLLRLHHLISCRRSPCATANRLLLTSHSPAPKLVRSGDFFDFDTAQAHSVRVDRSSGCPEWCDRENPFRRSSCVRDKRPPRN